MSVTRRELLLGTAAAGLAAWAPRPVSAAPLKPYRFVHMTDFHVQPELGAPKGMERALRHAMGKKPRLALLGGDLVMDVFAADEVRAQVQWDLFSSLLRDNCTVPVKYCIGNHDVWGWNKEKSRTTGREPRWGKQWFLEVAREDKTYTSFEAGGWKWLVLDTVQHSEDGYVGRVDPEQFEWFEGEIASTPKATPIIVVSHVPLFAPCTMVYAYEAAKGGWSVGGQQMTQNFNDVKKVFDAHPNVKLCVSGHIHLVDRFDYNGVSYLCNGAVCGAWWLGKNRDFEPGYVVVDLFPDGTFRHEFVTWGWAPG